VRACARGPQVAICQVQNITWQKREVGTLFVYVVGVRVGVCVPGGVQGLLRLEKIARWYHAAVLEMTTQTVTVSGMRARCLPAEA